MKTNETHMVKIFLDGEQVGSSKGIPCFSRRHANQIAASYTNRGENFTVEIITLTKPVLNDMLTHNKAANCLKKGEIIGCLLEGEISLFKMDIRFNYDLLLYSKENDEWTLAVESNNGLILFVMSQEWFKGSLQ